MEPPEIVRDQICDQPCPANRLSHGLTGSNVIREAPGMEVTVISPDFVMRQETEAKGFQRQRSRWLQSWFASGL
jgi:hypothetical protein